MGKYVLDANVFITPANEYYPFDIAPAFWDQFADRLVSGDVIIIDKVLDEVKNDDVCEWMKSWKGCIDVVKCGHDNEIIANLKEVINYIRDADEYSEAALLKWSNGVADPWIISAAMKFNACIVTAEKKTNISGNFISNPKIPNVAEHFDVPYISIIDYVRRAGIRFM